MTAPLEIAANAFATAAILLAGRNSIHTWWTGIVGCALFAVVFFQANLYADVVLQVFFVLSSVAGWRLWLRGNHGHALVVRPAELRSLAWIVPLGLACAAGYGALLHFWTDAYAPFADSMVLVFSVIAQLLLTGRRIENWPFWLLVNSIAVPLYASRGLYLTAFLYAVYWVNAIVAWLRWRKLARLQMEGSAVPAEA
ncbi:nicotinamide riboside transporter PnuC [Massilia brevitalea]|uniref:nicotinamide riboside transporter PnuC n=1 Tax=Massilia brevitalea TaxID=442526 RepID=UPI002738355D|nr:nicotinamide riboside transporter PnuC [Massilia brevitalea]